MLEQVLQGKICTGCNQWKPFSEFIKHTGCKNGVENLCKECKKNKTQTYIQHWQHQRQNQPLTITEQECKDCHHIKPLSEFGNDKYHKNGKSHICKTCKQQRQQRLKEKWEQQRTQQKNNPTHKTCIRCNQVLPITHFTKLSNTKIGYSGTCKTCQAQYRTTQKQIWQQQRQNQPTLTNKYCPHCHQNLPTTAFYPSVATKDGFSCYCKTCTLTKHKTTVQQWEHTQIQKRKHLQKKECIHCHQLLTITQFHKNRFFKDGYNSVCIPCVEKRSQNYMHQWKKDRTTQPQITEKKCIHCNQLLPLTMFSLNKRQKDGYAAECKTCAAQRQRTYITRWQHQQKTTTEETFSLYPSFEKKCKTCGKILPRSSFYVVKRRKDGLSSQCKTCLLKITKQQRINRKATLIPIIPTEKYCTSCKQTLPAAAFTKSSDSKDGLNRICRTCKNKKAKAYRHRPEVHKHLLSYWRQYRTKPKVRERERKWGQKYAQRPEVKKKRATYAKKYAKRTEVKEHRKQYLQQYFAKKKAQQETR